MRKLAGEWSLKTAISSCENTSLQDKIISSRYRETNFAFDNGDVVKGRINTFISPEMEIYRMDLHSAEPLTVLQDDAQERYVSTFVYRENIHSNFTFTNKEFRQQKQQHSFVHSKAADCKHTIAAVTHRCCI